MDTLERIQLIDNYCEKVSLSLEKKSGVGVTCGVKWVNWSSKQYSPAFCIIKCETQPVNNPNWFIPDGQYWIPTISTALNLSRELSTKFVDHCAFGVKRLLSINTEFDVSKRNLKIVEVYDALENEEVLALVNHCRLKYPEIVTSKYPDWYKPVYPFKNFDNAYFQTLVSSAVGTIHDVKKYASHFENECLDNVSFSVENIVRNIR
jgi:hypothetical protein